MSNRDLLKEAIADAKAVKEMAISNAKAALEEAFTPQLKSMLEKKLTEMEDEDNEGVGEAKMHDEGDSIEETNHEEADTVTEEELEEILAELEEGDEEEEPEADKEKKEKEGEEEFDLEEMSEEDLKAFIEDVVDEMIEAGELEAGEEEMEAPEMEAPEEVTDEESEEETEEEPMMESKEKINEAELGPAELTAIGGGIASVVGGSVALTTFQDKALAGNYGDAMKRFMEKLTAAGAGAAGATQQTSTDSSKIQKEEVMHDKKNKMEEGAEDEIADLFNKVHRDKSLDTEPEVKKALADLKKKVKEGVELEEGQINEGYGAFLPIIKMIATKAGIGMFGATVVAGMIPIAAIVTGAVSVAMIKKAVEAYKAKKKEEEEAKAAGELAEALETVETLRTELNEVNLLNSKLLYTNKIFKAKNLSETQKVKVLTTFDKAESVKEVKLVYETLLEGLVSTTSTAKEAIKESKSFASKAVGTSPKKPVVETDGMVSRFQKLAGIK